VGVPTPASRATNDTYSLVMCLDTPAWDRLCVRGVSTPCVPRRSHKFRSLMMPTTKKEWSISAIRYGFRPSRAIRTRSQIKQSATRGAYNPFRQSFSPSPPSESATSTSQLRATRGAAASVVRGRASPRSGLASSWAGRQTRPGVQPRPRPAKRRHGPCRPRPTR